MIIDKLEKYMLYDNNIITWQNNIVENKLLEKGKLKEGKKEKANEIKKNVELYKKFNEKDPLFWCFFYIVNGDFKYLIEKSNFATEKMQKIALVTKVRSHKDTLKKMKININHVEDKLLNCVTIDIITFISLCIIHNINLVLNEKYFYWSYNYSEVDIKVIKMIDKEVEIYIGDEVEKEITNIENNCIKATYNKKIKSISNYKILEIKEIAAKLNINLIRSNGKKKIKKEIYTEIQQYL